MKPLALIVHKPHTKDGQDELEDLVAAIHAQTVAEMINELPISRDKKNKMVEKMINHLR